MRILHIIDSLGLGGAQTVVKGVFESQFKNDNIFLYSLRKRKINTKINHKNVKVYDSTKKYSLKPLKELRHIIETEKIEVIHCHLFRSQVFGYILKKRYFPNVKLIMHEHGQIFLGNWYYDLFMSLAKKKTDLFIAVSKATKKELIKKAKIDSNKIKVLYNFVDSDRFNRKNITWNVQKEKEKLGIKKDEFVIGFAGRLIGGKGWKEFTESAKYLENEDVKFLIAGDGRDKDKLINLIKEFNLNRKVECLGYVENMVWFYSLLDCFVIPSHRESMGLTEIEAQAMGIPVIASNVPALNEIIMDKKTGLLFESKNSKDLAEKINLIYKNKRLRNNLIQNGLKSIKNYSLSNYINKLNKIYRELK